LGFETVSSHHYVDDENVKSISVIIAEKDDDAEGGGEVDS